MKDLIEMALKGKGYHKNCHLRRVEPILLIMILLIATLACHSTCRSSVWDGTHVSL